jgi:nucleoside-diphosphate-sugar epimerase
MMRVFGLKVTANRGAAPRILADALFLATALFLAFVSYVFTWVMLWSKNPNPRSFEGRFSGAYLEHVFILVAIGFVVFALSGFYTHTPGYRGRYKLLVIFNAVSLVFLLHAFLTGFMLRIALPRGVALFAWAYSFALIGGSRMFKGYVEHTYQIRRKLSRGERPVKNVLVVGGAGYIGSVLVRRLLEGGYKVRVLDPLLHGEAAIASYRSNPGFELHQADCRDVASVVRAVQEMDAVIHLGGIVGDPACNLDSKMTLEINVAATDLIRNVSAGQGIQRFLFASSCSVYGAREHLLNEKAAPQPISLYACTKLDSERIILQKRSPDFAPTVLRLGTAFGWSYRPRLDLVVNLLTAKAIFERRLLIFNRTQWRPFVHVEDIARAFIACLRAPNSQVAYEIFNVGSDDLNSTLGDLASRVQAQVPQVEIVYVDNPSDHRNYRVNFSKIAVALGFDCRHTLDYGIAEIKRAVETGLITDYRNPKYYNDRSLEQLGAQVFGEETEKALSASEEFLRRSAAATT